MVISFSAVQGYFNLTPGCWLILWACNLIKSDNNKLGLIATSYLKKNSTFYKGAYSPSWSNLQFPLNVFD